MCATVIDYLTRKVNEALAKRTMSSDNLRKQKAAELNQARKELENVEKAILMGVVTPTTKRMLLEAEEKIEALEAELKAPPSRPKVVALSTTVMKHLADLRVAFGRDNERARNALRRLVKQVVLRRHGDRLMAEVTRNLRKLLDLDSVENAWCREPDTRIIQLAVGHRHCSLTTPFPYLPVAR